MQNFTDIVPGEPLDGELKCKRGSEIIAFSDISNAVRNGAR